MVTRPLFGDDPIAPRVFSVLCRLGHDGRGVTLTSLVSHTGIPGIRLRATLERLVQAGAVAPAGSDPLASDLAFRLPPRARAAPPAPVAA
ncbi:hypothetical protein [Acetobacter cerevisiae]|uniref:hypothetical protein n=1 Tax=Acetobacter cerevisiae TaxID=178900 RepID=UPI0020A14341|nr:hypothetical protein [Acetobacter cerevisiae]MCP1271603.1 hypothetical protein [Acetobacter cerevisiae]MCP1279557.1 hypothetical protein [Acetobacter cerevisiae]